MSDLIANLFATGVSDSYKRDPNMDRLVAEERFDQVEEKILETLNEEKKYCMKKPKRKWKVYTESIVSPALKMASDLE